MLERLKRESRYLAIQDQKALIDFLSEQIRLAHNQDCERKISEEKSSFAVSETARYQHVVDEAKQLAKTWSVIPHSGHILHALMSGHPCDIAQVMIQNPDESDKVREYLEPFLSQEARSPADNLGQILKQADTERVNRNRSSLATEHLLLAILYDKATFASVVLGKISLDYRTLKEVLAISAAIRTGEPRNIDEVLAGQRALRRTVSAN